MQKKLLKTDFQMQRKHQAKIYNEVALIYDYLMKSVNYKYWSDYIYSITKKHIKSNSDVLELAAGNCSFSKYFIKRYPNLIVTDLSLKMLQHKTQKNIPKVCCSMIDLPFNIKFNLIYSTFDSINYILTENELIKLFKVINYSLTDKGIVTFDVSLEKNSYKHLRYSHREGIYQKIHFEQKSEYNEKTRIHKNSFEINKDGKIFKEVHKQKIYPFETYFDLLDQTGFFVVNCYEAFTFNNGKSNSDRVQFVIKKMK